MDFTVELKDRIRGVQRFLSEKNLDALTVSDERNLRYLYGVETGRGVVTPNSCILWVRDLYHGVYSGLFEKAPYSVRAYRRGVIETYFKRVKPYCVGFEDVSVSQFRRLKKKFGVRRARVVDVVERLRMIKSPYEMSLIKRSAGIAKAGMRKAYEVVGEGVPELYAVASIEASIRKAGSETPPFEGGMICAGGAHAADIHAHPSMKKIRRGLVVVDLGARYCGYHSDMTRTIPLGRLTKREKTLMKAVENIRDETVDFIEVGRKVFDVHNFAEKKIKALGYEFAHFIGHGVGLAIHERPSLSPESRETLKEGMVFTIEPGIYIPKKFGVRFEDTLYLTKKGPRMLTRL